MSSVTSLPKIMRTIDDIARSPSVDKQFVEESRKYWYYKDVIFNDKEPEKAMDEYPLMSRFKTLKDFVKWYSTIIYRKLRAAIKRGEINKSERATIKRLLSLYSLAAPDDVTIFPVVEKKMGGYLVNSGVRHVEVVYPEAILPNGKKIALTY